MSANTNPPIKFHETIAYEHTQYSKMLFVLLGLPVVVCLGGALTIPTQQHTLFTVGFFLVIIAWMFSSLRITVSDRFLHWRFGPGLIHKKVALAQIKEFEITRTTLLEGWGIHYTNRGWLYNVSGYDAIFVTCKDGKRFVLGSNDVNGLSRALANWQKRQVAAQ
jgi:hypothetical protein